jgi:hypothetical protein
MSQNEQVFTAEERRELAVKAVNRLIADAEAKRLLENKELTETDQRCGRRRGHLRSATVAALTALQGLRDKGHIQPGQKVAACSNVKFSGLMANPDSGAHTYSAKAPLHIPNTSSPGLKCITLLPTASTCPATSTPGRVSLGLRSPNSMRKLCGLPFIKPASSGLTEAARTFIKTSLSLGTGLSTSSI